MHSFQHPADAWYHIEPKGEHFNATANVVQVIDDEAIMSIVNRFNAEAAQPNFAGMLIDQEHFKHDEDKETRAFGWLMKLQGRADGIYGQIRWTNTGKAAVDGGDYRFFSTEYDPKDCVECGEAKDANKNNDLQPADALRLVPHPDTAALRNTSSRRVRPLRLDGLTLTNSPNNKGQKPITNRTSGRAEPVLGAPQNFRRDAGASAAGTTTDNKTHTMKLIANRLKLSAEASEDSIVAELDKLFNRVRELETQNTELSRTRVEAALEKYKNRFKADKREAWKNRLTKDYADAVDALESLPETSITEQPTGARRFIHNRSQTRPPESASPSEGTDERTTVDKIKNRAHELQSQNSKRRFDECWNQAAAELLHAQTI